MNAGEKLVDHVNENGLDNRRSNLRVSTKSENGCNRGANRNNKSGFKGVCLFKPTGTWKAEIMVSGKRKHLGYYPSPELAHEGYCRAASELHGQFANVG